MNRQEFQTSKEVTWRNHLARRAQPGGQHVDRLGSQDIPWLGLVAGVHGTQPRVMDAMVSGTQSVLFVGILQVDHVRLQGLTARAEVEQAARAIGDGRTAGLITPVGATAVQDDPAVLVKPGDAD